MAIVNVCYKIIKKICCCTNPIVILKQICLFRNPAVILFFHKMPGNFARHYLVEFEFSCVYLVMPGVTGHLLYNIRVDNYVTG